MSTCYLRCFETVGSVSFNKRKVTTDSVTIERIYNMSFEAQKYL